MGRPKKLPIHTRFYTPTSSKEKLPSFVWKHILKILVSVKIIYKTRERPISHLFLVLTSSEWETTVFPVPNSILHRSQPNKNPKSDWRNLFSPWPACVTEAYKSVLSIFHEHCSKIHRENATRGSERRRNAQQQQPWPHYCERRVEHPGELRGTSMGTQIHVWGERIYVHFAMSFNLGLHQTTNVFVYNNKGILLLSLPIQKINIPVHLAYLFLPWVPRIFDRVSNRGHFSKHLIIVKTSSNNGYMGTYFLWPIG
jgi:hypothetical protein